MPFAAIAGGTRLVIHAQPRARQSGIAGWHGAALKVRLAAPPVDGAANEELCRFLATALDLPRSSVTLKSGASSRAKVVEVVGLPPAEVARRLGVELPG